MVSSEAKKILCAECKTTERMNVRDEGEIRSVVRHRTYCTQGDFCWQHITSDSYRYGYATCGRPAKGYLKNGAPACGIHLRGERKRDLEDQRHSQARELDKWAEEEVERKIEQIKELTGIEAFAEIRYWNGRGSWTPARHTGRIILDPDALLEAIED